MSYPLDDLFEEVAFVAYHFHWRLEDVLNLEHGDRQRFIEEISKINRHMSEGGEAYSSIPLEHWQ